MALHLAKGKPRTLAYSSNLRDDLKLLEVSEDLLQELQEDGLAFKGGPNEEAVLCSSNKTFAVKQVETTNLVLMVDPSTDPSTTPHVPSPAAAPSPPGEVIGLATQQRRNEDAALQPNVIASAIVTSHMELIQVAPRLQALDALLADRPIGGHDDEEEDSIAATNALGDVHMVDFGAATRNGKTFEELLAEVQASEAELVAALEAQGAVCINGRWRGLDPEHLGTLLELILLTAVERGWVLEEGIPGQEAAEALAPHGFLPQLTHHCLRTYSKPVLSKQQNKQKPTHTTQSPQNNDHTEQDTTALYILHPEAVCRHFGLRLLSEQPRWGALADFEAAWKAAVPETMVPSMELLRGEALVDSSAALSESGGGGGGGGIGVVRLSVKDLPRDAAERFQKLFSVRSRWEFPDLEPYIESLAGPGETVEMLLLKYARASQQRPEDPVTYSTRF